MPGQLSEVEDLWIDPSSLNKAFIDFCYKDSSHGFGPHITRYGYYNQIKKSVLQNKSFFDKKKFVDVLDMSGSLRLATQVELNISQSIIIKGKYPDICFPKTNLESNKFDLVLSDQVFEHIKASPWETSQEINRILKPGGLALITTCFCMPLHRAPSDYFRFSEESLELIFSDCNFKILQTGSWGNRAIWYLSNMGFRFMPVPHNIENPIHKIAIASEKGSEIATWILVEKV